MFADRSEAGRELAAALMKFKALDPVVLALVRGGLPVAYEVADALDAPLDILLVRKIGAPERAELAVGAVVDGPDPEIVINYDVLALFDMTEEDVRKAAEPQLAEIERRRALYLGGRPRVEIKGKTAIIVDDGVATGATTRAALHAVRRQEPARLILAVPVAPFDSLDALRREADEIVCLETPEPFFAIGYFYRDFRQISDEEVIGFLDRAGLPAEKLPVEATDRVPRPISPS